MDKPETIEIEKAQFERMVRALEFYGDPDTYFAIGFFPDPPCGDFVRDFGEHGDPDYDKGDQRPGHWARAVLNAKYIGDTRGDDFEYAPADRDEVRGEPTEKSGVEGEVDPGEGTVQRESQAKDQANPDEVKPCANCGFPQSGHVPIHFGFLDMEVVHICKHGVWQP